MSSNSFAKYGQHKKRLAIKQIQQRAKRQASSSSNNPFTWTRATDSQQDEDDAVFTTPSTVNSSPNQPLPITAVNNNNNNNPFVSHGNIFARAPVVPHTPVLSQSRPRPPSMESNAPRKQSNLQHRVGRRNPDTMLQNREQLEKDFSSSPVVLTDVGNSSKFVRKQGTCLQMCSMEEFSKRSEQEIYSVFETEGGRFVHHLAVKEYKRASADQEESKEEDLRPSVVLLKTVEYLFTRLLEQHSNSFEDIYDFLWDRTRAVRKDITQQRLCDMNTVVVLETITRFHIYSSYTMSESTEGTFEHKYNNENLEKALTSLRHLYDDLKTSADSCVNEAEFRMYHILLNLNSGQVMRDVSKYEPKILGSENVKYAISCYNAYNSKNFVLFFRLFRRGSLLACCILYRYISNMRQKALVSIINSHTTSSRGPASSTSNVQFPVDKLVRLLGFESPEEAVQFCAAMSVSTTQDVVYLRHRQYEVNDERVEHRLSVIDRKITKPLGSIIFTGDSVSDQVIQVSAVPYQSPATPRILITPAVLERAAQQLITTFVFKDVQKMISESFTELQYLEKSKVSVIRDLIDEACQVALREELLLAKGDRKKKTMIHTKNLYEHNYPSPLLDKVLRELVLETMLEETGLTFVEEKCGELLSQAVYGELFNLITSQSNLLSQFDSAAQRASTAVAETLLSESITSHLKSLLSETESDLHVERKAELKQLLDTNVVQKRYYFNVWKSRYAKIYSKRHTLDKIPPRILPSSSYDVLRSLLGGDRGDTEITHLRISNIAQIDLTSPTKSLQKKIDVQKKLKLRMDLLEEAISLKGMPLGCLSNLTHSIYVTIAVESFATPVSRFILDSFSVTCNGPLGEYTCQSVTISGCELKLQLVELSQASRDLLNDTLKSCDLIVVQSNCEDHITSVVKSNVPSPKILISEQCPVSWSYLHVAQPREMTNYKCCSLYKTLDAAVSDALHWQRPSQEFRVVNCRDFIQTVMCARLTDILLAKQVVLKKQKQYSVDPNIITAFYNCIIQSIATGVKHCELRDIDWPSHYDKCTDVSTSWNSPDKLDKLSSDILNLRLPKFHGDPDSSADCLNYCSSVETFNSPFLLANISTVIDNNGVQWCTILNQLMHHVIENALFLTSHTVLLETQIQEIYSTVGGHTESVVDRALIFNDLDDMLLPEYDPPIDENDISDIWQSLSKYESRTPQPKQQQPLPDEYLECETRQVDGLSEELRQLSSSISETETRLQRLVQECNVPSYLVNAIL